MSKPAPANLDAIDRKILAVLQENSGLSNVDLATRVGLSPSPCLRRVKSLEERGIITGYRAVIDRRAIGLGIRAFVEVKLERQSDGITGDIVDRLKRMPEVMSIYFMTGGLDFLLDVLAPDLESYGEFTTQRLIGLPGVKEIRSSFVLKEIDCHPALPIG